MNATLSAGMLMYRSKHGALEFFLVHPGGPFFRNRDLGFWTIPKGLTNPGEDPLAAASREFTEETGIAPTPPFVDIGSIRQKGGKMVKAWAFRGDWEPEAGIKCNEFIMEWPPRSGNRVSFPEVDRAAWMHYEEAKQAIIAEQIPFLDRTIEGCQHLPES